MKLLLELSMECEPLARADALAACEALGHRARVLRHEPGVLIIETRADALRLAARVGLCHYVNEWLGSCPPDELGAHASGIDVEGPIRVRATKVGTISPDLAEATRVVGGVIGRGKGVDLRHPKTDIRIVFSRCVHIGRVIGTVDRSSFERRKNRYMPFTYPASLHPKYARALVNLSRAAPGGRMLDPFCGTGAVLAEAALVGAVPVGSDISEEMIEGARKNLHHLGLRSELLVSDVGRVPEVVGSVDSIATDPPYGRSASTKGESLPKLYARAFSAFAQVLEKGAYVGLVVPRKSLLDAADDFVVIETHPLYVHGSLTRHFCALKRG
ncbi:MAG: methyltransferase domain-containing protein [Thermoplasmata archaeon]